MSDKEVFVALLFLDHAVLLPRAVHTIKTQLRPNDEIESAIAHGMFPLQTLIGRSCHPNCTSFMAKGCRTIITSRAVEPGEMVSKPKFTLSIIFKGNSS